MDSLSIRKKQKCQNNSKYDIYLYVLTWTIIILLIAGIMYEHPIDSIGKIQDSVWVCETPKIVLEISSGNNGEQGSKDGSKAFLEIGGENIEIEIMLERGRYALVAERSTGRTLLGGFVENITNRRAIIRVNYDLVCENQVERIILKRKKST